MQVESVIRNLLGDWVGTSYLKHTSRVLLHNIWRRVPLTKKRNRSSIIPTMIESSSSTSSSGGITPLKQRNYYNADALHSTSPFQWNGCVVGFLDRLDRALQGAVVQFPRHEARAFCRGHVLR